MKHWNDKTKTVQTNAYKWANVPRNVANIRLILYKQTTVPDMTNTTQTN